jgi:hypothetical protein
MAVAASLASESARFKNAHRPKPFVQPHRECFSHGLELATTGAPTPELKEGKQEESKRVPPPSREEAKLCKPKKWLRLLRFDGQRIG